MLYKSLNFKLILTFVLFIIIIIAAIGTIMLNSIFSFYIDEFKTAIEDCFKQSFINELKAEMNGDSYYENMKTFLLARNGEMGIDKFRNFYILNMNGDTLYTTNDEKKPPMKTANILAAMNRRKGDEVIFGADYMDYAIYISNDGDGENFREAIIYIYDTQDKMRKFTWNLFTIIIQALLISLLIAIILSFVLANGIASPIRKITDSAKKLSEGEFEGELEAASNDEIGTLIAAFNNMSDNLKNKMDEVSGEREKLETIFLYLQDGVFAFAADGMLLHINPRGSELFNSEINYDSSLSDLTAMLNLKVDLKKIKEKNSVIFRDTVYADSYFDINIGTFKYKEDKLTREGTIVVMQDITQRYTLEKSRREFISNVSHELNTPLTPIRAAAETILENKDIAPELKEKLLKMVISNSDRMKRIIQDLLLVSRIDNRKMMLKFAAVNVSKLIESIYFSMEIEAKKKNHEFVMVKDDNLNDIYADKERIEQVLTNIISNAIKYTPDGGQIVFTVQNYTSPRRDGFPTKDINPRREKEFKGVKFTVADNGIGIPKEDQPHIFERFYRVDKARSADAGGTGLGLSISREFVYAHKGRITMKSDVGRGTTMTVILPSLPEEEAENENQGAPEAGGVYE